jgi:UDP-glucose 4-epimerase
LKIHHSDVGSVEAASLLGMRQPDVVFHLAALPRRPASAMALGRAFTTTLALLDAVRVHAIPKVVVALPATALYGNPATRDLPLKEQPLEPRGLRGVIARATVDLLAVHREVDAIEFTVLALATVYGPRQRADSGVVAALVDAAAAGRPPTITGDGRQTRDLVFVDDAVDALVRAGTRGSGLVVNVGTGEQTSVRELWNLVSGGGRAEPIKAPARPDELPRFALSPVRARIHLGWSPWTSVADGLRQTR